MITVVTPVSPIPSHPDTSILERTVESVRHHLPDAEIVLLFDGVRDEQEHLTEPYREHIAKVLKLGWGNVSPFLFANHTHQVGMLRNVIDDITTPLMMFVEQDTPLLTDRAIDWALITEWLLTGRSNCIRLYHEEVVPEPHQYLMHGMDAGPFLKTAQYSARPHVATVSQYRKWLTEFTPHANTFLEDKLHSVVQEAVKHQGWGSQKVHIYAPDNDGWRRSDHLNGRGAESKFEEKLIF